MLLCKNYLDLAFNKNITSCFLAESLFQTYVNDFLISSFDNSCHEYNSDSSVNPQEVEYHVILVLESHFYIPLRNIAILASLRNKGPADTILCN